MSKLEIVVEEETVECSFSLPTKLCKRLLSFLLAGVFTFLGTLGLKVELKLNREDSEVTHDVIP